MCIRDRRYTGTDRGRATRAMAYHFLAKAYLTRGSAVADVRGQKSTDMDSVIVFADSVIARSGHALEADYGSLFNAGYPDGKIPVLGENGTPPLSSKAVSYTHLDVYKRQVSFLYGSCGVWL